jgi:hypothetical protein
MCDRMMIGAYKIKNTLSETHTLISNSCASLHSTSVKYVCGHRKVQVASLMKYAFLYVCEKLDVWNKQDQL